MKEKKKKKVYVTKGSLILRIIASVYLIYTVYHLVLAMLNDSAERTEVEKIIIYLVIIIFTISALFLGITSIKKWIHKDYLDENSKDEDSKDEDSKDEDSKDEDSKDEDSKDEDSKDEDSKDEDSKDEDSKDEDSKDEDSKDEDSKDDD